MSPFVNPRPHLEDAERLPALIESLAAPDPEEARIPISQYLWIVKRHRWKILGFCAAAAIATVISARLTPIFESTTTVDVDRRTPPGVVGPEAALSAVNDADQFLSTQMKLVQSDGVLRPVEERFRLRQREGQSSAESAWGGGTPIVLKRLRVTRPPNTYLMLISYRSDDPQLAADAANAIAQSYLEYSYEIRSRSSASLSTFMERQLGELKAKMEHSSLAVAAFERELSVINPEEKTNILGSRLVQLNTEYTSAQTERLRKQAAWESIQGGTFEAALAAPQGESLRKLSDHRQEAREHFADVGAYYGANHPEYRRAQAQLDQMDAALENTRADIARRVEVEFREGQRREEMAGAAVGHAKTEFDLVNARSYEYQTVKREADADKTLYAELVRKIKEAGINAGFQNSAIRIADSARPALKPVSPNVPLNALLALLFAALLAVGGAVLSDLLDKTVRDPEQVARTLRAEVVGSLLVGVVSVVAYYASPGRILWLFSSPYPDIWGPFLSRNNFAQFMELVFPVALWLACSGRRAEDPLTYMWMSAVMLACGLASSSRAGAVLLVLESLGVFLLVRPKPSRRLVAGFAAGAVVLGALGGGDTLIQRFHDSDPLRYRREIYASSVAMIAERPWTGYGLGTFVTVYPEFATFDAGAVVEHAHDDWLEWASEGGWPYAAVWLLLALAVVRPALRSIWGIGVVAVFLHALVDYPFARFGVAAWLFILVGVLENSGTKSAP